MPARPTWGVTKGIRKGEHEHYKNVRRQMGVVGEKKVPLTTQHLRRERLTVSGRNFRYDVER